MLETNSSLKEKDAQKLINTWLNLYLIYAEH